MGISTILFLIGCLLHSASSQFHRSGYGGNYDDYFHPNRNPGSLKNNESTFTRKVEIKVTQIASGSQLKTILFITDNSGPDYEIKFDGDLPVPQHQLLDWFEKNKHLYKPIEGSETVNGFKEGDISPMTSTTTVATPKPIKTTTAVPSTLWKKILPEDCGKRSEDFDSSSIIHRIEDNPWQVAIMDAGTSDIHCGGTIITKFHVLTAAHCFVLDDPSEKNNFKHKLIDRRKKYIHAGATNLTDTHARKYEIQDLRVHVQYRRAHKRNDIAFIKVVPRFKFSELVGPICLPTKKLNYIKDKSCRISGWGKMNSDSPHGENTLHSKQVKIVGEEECRRENSIQVDVSKGMFCAGDYDNGSVDSCQGDSGGPCFCDLNDKIVLYGITSWGVGCGIARHPGVYVKLDEYILWIRTRLSESVKRHNLIDDL